MATKKQLEQVLSELEHVGPNRRAEALRTYLRLVRPVVAECMNCCYFMSKTLLSQCSSGLAQAAKACKLAQLALLAFAASTLLLGAPSCLCCTTGLLHNLHTACPQVRELKVRDSENVTVLGEELLRKHRSQLGGEECKPPRFEPDNPAATVCLRSPRIDIEKILGGNTGAVC